MQPTPSLFPYTTLFRSLNGEFLNKQAGIFAQRLQKEAGNEAAQQVRLALNLVTQRPPTDEEVQRGVRRSEEHTSELQSLRHLVCRLLLEKKKQRTQGAT